MKATYVDHLGTDLSVVNAARVSFNKKSEWANAGEVGVGYVPTLRLSDKDKRLIKYLAKHNHWSPFAHTSVTLHLKMPLFVARHIDKHQVGFVVNEVSRRYVTQEPEFYVPEVWRKAAENVKQGSSNEVTEAIWGTQAYVNAEEASLWAYSQLLKDGVCPEQARMILPQSMYTEQYKTGSLNAWARLYLGRTDPHVQKETRDLAHQIGKLIEPLYPVSWSALTGETS